MSEEVGFSTLRSGFNQAARRFEDARLRTNREATYFALFESLNWAVALDEYVSENWFPDGVSLKWKWRDHVDGEGGEIVRGVRFARNRVHHQWADAVRCSTGGFQFPIVAPIVSHEWCWRSADSLPTSDKNSGIKQYETHLSQRPVRTTLSALRSVYWAIQVEK